MTDGLTAEAGAFAGSRGVSFFDSKILQYYTADNATLGASGSTHFFMPLEDSAVVSSTADAARYTGMAPSVARAYLTDQSVFGISFPTEGLSVRVPTAADAITADGEIWPHYLEGGNTAVFTGGENGGYLLNSTREFVTPGGNPVPTGSVLFQLGENGEWIPLRKW